MHRKYPRQKNPSEAHNEPRDRNRQFSENDVTHTCVFHVYSRYLLTHPGEIQRQWRAGSSSFAVRTNGFPPGGATFRGFGFSDSLCNAAAAISAPARFSKRIRPFPGARGKVLLTVRRESFRLCAAFFASLSTDGLFPSMVLRISPRATLSYRVICRKTIDCVGRNVYICDNRRLLTHTHSLSLSRFIIHSTAKRVFFPLPRESVILFDTLPLAP